MDTLNLPIHPGLLADRDLLLRCEDYSWHETHKAPCFHFAMVHAESSAALGWLRLRVGSSLHIERYAGHIGYSVEPEHRGHRYAARSVQLIVPFARSIGLDPLWITCDPENLASRRTLELTGAEFVEIAEVPADCIIHKSGHPKKCRYRL
jgi:predicted acetyltransferase